MTGGYAYKHGLNEYWLVYTADAYFEIAEKYGADFTEKIRPGSREAYNIAVGCFCILAREGELCRRYMGYDERPIVTEEDVRRTHLPDGVAPLKDAVWKAVLAGLRVEVEEEKKKKPGEKKPVDVGLLEFEKKTMPGNRKPD